MKCFEKLYIIFGLKYLQKISKQVMHYGSVGKESACDAGEMQETRVRYLGGEDPLEEGMATHSSIPAENPMDRGAW